MSTHTTITYPFTDIVAGVNAVMPHASKDQVTPVITGVQITAEGALLATDRYTVGWYTPPTVSVEGEFDGAIIPIEAVKFVAKMRATQLGMGKGMAHEYAVRFVFQPEIQGFQIELGYGSAEHWVTEQSATFTAVTGNYPPLGRLFPDDTTKFGAEAPLRLNTSFLVRIQTATKWMNGDATALFRFVHSENPESKPGPVYVTVGKSFKALIQPAKLVA